MRILINCSSLKKGGGQNVGLNFIRALNEIEYPEHTFYFIVAENSRISNLLLSNKLNNLHNIYIFSSNPFLRIIQEQFELRKILKENKIDILYSYFGYTFTSKKIVQVSGVAVSNIFFPEINFWSEYSGLSLIKKRLIDRFRIFGIKRSDGLIFENETMMLRSHILFNIASHKTAFIRPSNNLIGNTIFDRNSERSAGKIIKKNIKILLLCGWHRNKNIFRLPKIAYEIKKQNKIKFEFILTAPEDQSIEHRKFIGQLNDLKVTEEIRIIGPVQQENLRELYQSIDFVLLMSKLESFSNNIIESWVFGKPLLITDSEWAHSICKNAAHYINRESPPEIANAIIKLSKSFDLSNKLIENGYSELRNYPNIFEKTKSEISYLIQIYENVKIT